MRLIAFLFILIPSLCLAQFDPAGGESGSKAVHRDDMTTARWADSVVFNPGWKNISDTTQGRVEAGLIDDVLGAANNRTLSFGDGGTATFYYDQPIIDVEGPDIVVFENGFAWSGGYFLELAFVEVSSDGNRYVRFPSVSSADTSDQIGNLAYMECQWYHNFAGKHQAPYGTPFDLSELRDSSIDLSDIHYIRLIDVVGALNDSIGNRDSKGNLINDPWPTGFENGGFDLDAVGVMRFPLSIADTDISQMPNPVSTGSDVNFEKPHNIQLFDLSGKLIVERSDNSFAAPAIPGLYIVSIDNSIYKLCVQ